ncbi:MAG: SDR family NAD(P)-dependent oxidoreductase, partial [Cyanobacteria bacterium P01_H01_bin.121]
RHFMQVAGVHKIFATYRNAATATELLALETLPSSCVSCLQLDLTDEAQIQVAVENIQATVGQLHYVVNCVGLLHSDAISPEKSLRHLNADQLSQYFQVNSIGPALLAKHLLPLLNHSQFNVLATISAKIGSISDNQIGGWYGYRASKAALNMLLKTASIEYSRRSKHTAIVMLHPGTTDTRLSQPFQRGVPSERLFSVDRTVTQLLAILTKLTIADNGKFFAWDGSELPW